MAKHPHACLTCAQSHGCPRSQCSSNVAEDERCCEFLGACELEKIAKIQDMDVKELEKNINKDQFADALIFQELIKILKG